MRTDLDKSDQELFDLMVAHLRKQGTTAILDGMSAYHGLDDRRCPVGAVIPDDLYDSRMEGKAITQLSKVLFLSNGGSIYHMPEELNMFFRWHHNILKAMQHVHDTVPPALWEREFQVIAAKYKLLLDGKVIHEEPAAVAST